MADILVVEDSLRLQRSLARGLGHQGHRVMVAGNGRDALRKLENEPTDLLILDMMIPEVSGLEVLKALDHRGSSLPVLVLSAKAAVEERIEGLRAGADDYLVKPFDFGELCARVDSLLRRSSQSLQLGALSVSPLSRSVTRAGRALPLATSDFARIEWVARSRRDAVEHVEQLSKEEVEALGPALRAVLPGLRLTGKFQLKEEIGSGGFGTVFRAFQTDLRREVAVKMLLPRPQQPQFRENLSRFKKEGISACRIEHPAAVRVLETDFTTNGIGFLVMELLRGPTLAEEISRNRSFDLKEAGQVIVPLCRLLQVAHRNELVHRDVKPQNIILHKSGGRGFETKLVDFGLAKWLSDAPRHAMLSQTLFDTGSQIIGTPAFMAPEMLLGGSASTPKTDIYGLCITAYWMLALASPYPRAAENPFAHLVDPAPPLPLKKLRPDLPPELCGLLQAGLSQQPMSRPSLGEIESSFSLN